MRMPRTFENKINIPRMVTDILRKNTQIHLVSKANDKSKMSNEPDTKNLKKKTRKLRGFSEKQTIGYIHKIFRNASTPLMCIE